MPIEGLIPPAAAAGLAPTFDRLGVLARSAAEVERVATVLLADERTETSRLPATVGRIGVVGDLRDRCETSVRRAVADGLDALESAGHRLDLVRAAAAVATADRRARNLLDAERVRALRVIVGNPAVRLDRVTRGRLPVGPAIDEVAMLALQRERTRLVREFEETFLARVDVLALPVLLERTPPVSRAHADQPSFDATLPDRMTALTLFANYLGLPVVAVPLGLDDRGLPTAMQLVGRRGSDAGLLAAAARLQERTHWHGAVPDAIFDIVGAEEDLLA
jgi:aspartyl-tRNA(Asn)/glutamyl-tRNA(Gln) amidotransferase subunit A